MRTLKWKKFFISIASGATLMQAPGCTETATILTSVFTGVTAGGVLYIINRIVND
jgi:hypothetical protein